MGKARTPKEKELTPAVDPTQLVAVEQMSGDTKKDRRLLREMADEAHDYLLSFSWCKAILRSWFGWGVGGVCAVFLFKIEPSFKSIDKWLWVIVGDLPPAYLVVDASPSPLAALHNYVDLMQEWVDTVKLKGHVEDCIPVNAPPTLEYANLLQRRLHFIRKNFLSIRDSKRGAKEDGNRSRTRGDGEKKRRRIP